MIRKRLGTLFILLFFLAVLTGGIIYDDLSASDGSDPYQAIKLLNEAVHQVADKYVDPLPSDSLYMRALEGMLLSLDPYSQLLTPGDYDDLRIHTQGNYEGLGIRIDIVDQVLTVISPIEGTPAHRAGLLPGDQILKVDGVTTRGWSEEKAVQELRGPRGSKVTLSIGREGLGETFDVEITRRPITLSAVPYAFMLRDGIGYVRFTQFSEHGRDEVREAIRDLEKKGMRSLILDVRGNPGGLLDQSIEVTDLFLPKGAEIVSTRGRMPESDRVYEARDNDDFSVHPMIVLVDRASASASEILAGALQHYKRATLVGERTFGKGSVQEVKEIELDSLLIKDENGRPVLDEAGRKQYGAAARITTAKWFLPSGKTVEKERIGEKEGEASDPELGKEKKDTGGVEPDIKVTFPERDLWKDAEFEKLRAAGKIEDYVAKEFPSHKELFQKLATLDGGDPSKYPGYDALYESLGTRATKEEVRELVREYVRKKVQDDRQKAFYMDLQLDVQLQRAILEACKATKQEAKKIKEYEHFAVAK